MSTAPKSTRPAIDRLAEVHPHHVERIREEIAALQAGTVVRFVNPKQDTARFYTGMRGEDAVIVSSRREQGLSVQAVDAGCHLAVYDAENVEAVPVEQWTVEQIEAGKRAAETSATAALESAYCSANRLIGGGPRTDEAALASLHYAHRLRNYAFALGVLAAYVRGY